MTNDELNKRFGEGLRAMREGRGMSLCAFARKAGVDKGVISRIERGLASPNLSTINTISIGMGYSRPEWFFLDIVQRQQ